VKRESLGIAHFDKGLGQQMLSGVLLHVVKTPLPIDPALNLRTRNRFFQQMNNPPAFVFKHVDNRYIVEGAGVMGLPAGGRVEHGMFKNDSWVAFNLRSPDNPGRKVSAILIFNVKLGCHPVISVFKRYTFFLLI
jgi:hypothetical protein